MIAIQVLDELDNSTAKGIDDDLNLLRSGNEFNHLLESSGSMLVKGYANQVNSSILDEDCTLIVVALLKKLLAEVIPKGIGHQLNNVLISLQPNHMNFFGLA